MKVREIENEFAKIWIENNIQFALFKPKDIDLDVAKRCVALRVSNSQDLSLPLLIDIRRVKSINKEARDYLASEEGVKLVKAAALLLDSYVGKLMGNFFLQINKPNVPTRIFNSQEEGEKWLVQFI